MEKRVLPRSESIERSLRNFNWASLFSAVIYPALGLLALIIALAVGFAFEGVHLRWWHLPLGFGVGALTLFLCNQGIGGLHRVWQHRAGELKLPAQIFVMANCILAMQGTLRDWVNYHSQHHRFSDRPGDPHNPNESKFWAWIGWILWRDKNDMARPTPKFLESIPTVRIADRHYNTLSLALHLIIPGIIYLVVWAMGGSLILTFILHAAAIIARGVQFHATVLGINVFGHMNIPTWATYLLALLTGGEAFHDHHHDHPKSVLHLPRKGFFNRIFDYNGTMLLVFEKLRLAKSYAIAPQFLPAPVKAEG